MANSLEYAKKFLPIIDDIYKASAITAEIDTGTKVDFTGVNEVKVLKVATTGLGDYSRTDGYPKGDITASWETLKLTEERGKEFSIDRMDDEETLGMVFGTVTGQFMRDWVIPELDAYRFAKYASTPGITTTTAAVLTKDSILEAIDEAVRQMDEDEVPAEGRRLYVNSDLKPILNSALNRQWGSDGTVNTVLAGYNNMPIIYVPKSRFYTGITLADGSTSWGYTKAAPVYTVTTSAPADWATKYKDYYTVSDGVYSSVIDDAAPQWAEDTYYKKTAEGAANINFMIIYPGAILQAKKFALPKIFSPDVNQDKDAWKFQFRLYHDAFVYENKVKGVYLHKSTT
jgi:hypothetical protein